MLPLACILRRELDYGVHCLAALLSDIFCTYLERSLQIADETFS